MFENKDELNEHKMEKERTKRQKGSKFNLAVKRYTHIHTHTLTPNCVIHFLSPAPIPFVRSFYLSLLLSASSSIFDFMKNFCELPSVQDSIDISSHQNTATRHIKTDEAKTFYSQK